MHPLFSRFYYAYKVRPAGRFRYAPDTGRPSVRSRKALIPFRKAALSFGQGRFYDQNFLIQ